MSFQMCPTGRKVGVWLAVLIVVLAGTVTAGNETKQSYNGYKLFSVRQNDQRQMDVLRQLQQLDDDLDFFKLDRVLGSEAHVLVPPPQVSFFKEVLDEEQIAYREIISNYEKTTHDSPFASLRSRSRTSPILTKYLRYGEMVDYLHSLAKRHPNQVTVSSIGKSFEGRDIPAITINSGARRGESRPVVFVDAGIHAREWAAPATAMFLISELVENAAQHADLLDGLTWTIVPLVNPDGYEFSHVKERLWRKTRRPSKNCFGIDGNRNFDYHWAEVGASNVPCSSTYHGEQAFSEPETRAIRNELLRLKGRCKFYLSLHTYGKYLLYPWGWTSALPVGWQAIDAVAKAGAAAIHNATGTHYTVGSSTNVLYAAAGGSDDWAHAVAEVPISITMELPGGGSDGFNPPPARIEEIVKESFVGIRAMALNVAKNYS